MFLYNTKKLLQTLPPWLYFSRPQNVAYHNLSTFPEKATFGIKSLLGLGLNFCITPRYSPKSEDADFTRFNRDMLIKFYFAGWEPLPPTKLFIRSNWSPLHNEIPAEFRVRINTFKHTLPRIFQYKQRRPNLLPSQQRALETNKQ